MKIRRGLITRFSVTIILLFSLPAFYENLSFCNSSAGEGEVIHLNTSLKLKRMSNGEVIISSPETTDFKNLTFTDFYADILMAAYRNQRLEYVIETCSKKYFSSTEECRREVKHAVNVLSEWKIIIIDRTAS